MISQDTIEQIKNSVVTHEILGNFLKLKKKGVDYQGLCPFHDEKTPSFSVSPSKNIYKCFGCGKGGDGISFLMEHQRMSYIEALRWVASKNNIHLSEDEQPKKFTKPTLRVEKPKSKILDWFEKERKITENTINNFGITEGNEWMPQIQSETPVICFNYYRVGELVNIKFRGAKKSFKMAKDAELIFYNLDAIENEDTVYITEGELDCLSLYECGIKNAVSVPNGASVNGNIRLEYLDNCWKYFVDKKRFILVVDNDTAGQRLQQELGRRLGYDRCYIVKYPDGCKDANDVLVKEGKDALLSVLDKCTLYPLDGEVMMDDMFETVVDFYENGYPKGFASGVSNEFDELLNFYPGQLTIVTGIPGCFYKNQLVHTSLGVKKISEINIGDKVLSYNHKEKINEYRKVTNTIQHKKHTDKLYKIKLKDGTIIKVTENHEFFTGIDYVKIKDLLLSLRNETMEKNT